MIMQLVQQKLDKTSSSHTQKNSSNNRNLQRALELTLEDRMYIEQLVTTENKYISSTPDRNVWV